MSDTRADPPALSRPAPRRRLTPEAARTAILDAATALVAEQGLDGLRVREVACRAGINHATLLHHVGDREGLLIALARRVVERLAGLAVASSIPGDPVAARRALDRHLDDILAGLADRPADFALLTEVFARAGHDASARALAAEAEARWTGFIVALLGPLARESAGERQSDLRQAALAITLLVRGYGLAIDRDPEALRRAVHAVADGIAGKGMRPDGRGGRQRPMITRPA